MSNSLSVRWWIEVPAVTVEAGGAGAGQGGEGGGGGELVGVVADAGGLDEGEVALEADALGDGRDGGEAELARRTGRRWRRRRR